MLRLHCLVEGQDAVFSVQVPLDARVQDLCQRVRKERKLSMFVDSELLPWKVDIDLTPYNYDFQGLKLLKVEEKRDTRLALWRNLSDFWSDDHLPPDRRLHILVKLSPIDCDSEPTRKRPRIEETDLVGHWMSKGVNQLIPPIQDLLGFIQRPLSDNEKIPITQRFYNKLISASLPDICDAKDVQTLFRVGEPYDHDRLDPILHAVGFKPFDVAGTESSFHHLWDTNIRRIIEVLEMSGNSNRDNSRNTETRKLRPDYSFTVKEKCPFRGEERGPENSEDPKEELASKMNWAYDPAPYVLGYYCKGMQMTLVALVRPDPPCRHPVVRDLVTVNLRLTKDRISNVCHLINLASLLAPLAGMIQFPPEFLTIIREKCKIEISGTNVVKRYTCQDGEARIQRLKATYDLLRYKCIPNTDRLLYTHKMAAHLTPRGIARQPKSEVELRQCLSCVLKTLIAIHNVPFYHRDIRWNNVICCIDDPSKWLLIDWEDAAAPPTTAQEDFCHSNHSTVVFRNGHGTEVDLWGVGHLIMTCNAVVPANLRSLGSRICQESTTLTARDVLQLLRTPTT